MKKVVWIFVVVLVGMFSGCMKPPKVEKYEEVKNHETAFVVQLEGDQQVKLDSEESLAKLQVYTKRIDLPQRFKKTGRWWWQGEWIPTISVLKVDRSPVTREWTAEATQGTSIKDEGIWAESDDSVGFSTGFACTAKVMEPDAAKFLYNYPNGSLEKVMDNQIRAAIQASVAEISAKYKMDELRSKKNEIIAKVREDVIPFFSNTGITITHIGMFGGFTYENPEIQQSIDKTFVAQQEKVVSKAQLEAQTDKNNTIEMEAKGLANAAITKAEGEAKGVEIKAQAEASAIRVVAEAAKEAQNNPSFLALKELEVEMARLKVWDGKYPQWYMSNGKEDLGILISPPMAQK